MTVDVEGFSMDLEDLEELLEGVDEESQLEDGYEYDYNNENISEEYLGELLGDY